MDFLAVENTVKSKVYGPVSTCTCKYAIVMSVHIFIQLYKVLNIFFKNQGDVGMTNV